MVHDTLPGLGIRSYLKKPQLPYMRIPGFERVEKNDLVVFSWPADTVRQFFRAEEGVDKPIDKKSNYVKRCVGTPGDSLQVIDGYVYVNGSQLQLSDRARPMYDYTVYSQKGVSTRWLRDVGADEFLRIYVCQPLNSAQQQLLSPYVRQFQPQNGQTVLYTPAEGLPLDAVRAAGISQIREVSSRERIVALTDQMVRELQAVTGVDSVVRMLEPAGTAGINIFPQDSRYPWNNDNFGPIYIPGKGDQVALTPASLPFYKKIILDYEGNQVSVSGSQVLLNGQPADSYTFKQDYYWMMGDNRDHSEDSRAWGYVPANHIVGKPVFIWMSFDNFNQGMAKWRPRWDRIFTTVGGSGDPRSYFQIFLIVLAVYLIGDFIWRRRKKKQQG